MNPTKSIRIPVALADQWLAALRSNCYPKGRGKLCEVEQAEDETFRVVGYCCLGVLQMVADNRVEELGPYNSRDFPTHEWLYKHGVQFFNILGEPSENPTVYMGGTRDRWDEAAIAHGSEYSTASILNDENDAPLTFPQIADLLEYNMEKY